MTVERGSDEKRRILYLLATLSSVALLVVVITIAMLYYTAIDRAQDQLRFAARAQAQLIESVARHDARYRMRQFATGAEATLSQVLDAFRRSGGFGETGEFLLARREGADLVVIGHQRPDPVHPERIPLDGTKGEPIRRAVRGESGVMIAQDYRGREVLAAYEPIRELNLGLVAKIDRTEIMAPFIAVAGVAGMVSLVAILFGAGLFLSVTNPFLRRLQESEERFRSLLETMPVGVWVTDREGRIVNANPAGQRIWAGARYVGVEQYGEYKAWWADSGKPIAAEEWALARAVRQGETSIDELIDIECFDGTRKTILYSAYPMRDAYGQITGAVAVNQDVSGLRRTELALRETAANLAKAEEVAHIGCWAFDLRTGEVFWSDELYRIFGLRPGECSPSYERFLEFVHPDDRDLMRQSVADSSRSGQPHSFSYRIRRADGVERIVLRHGQASRNEAGEVVRMFGVTQDITEQALAEQALRQSEQRFSRVFHASPAIISVTRLRDGVFLDVNEAFERASGWRREEILGRRALDIDIWPEPDQRAAMLERLRANGSLANEEWSFRHCDGGIRQLLGGIERIDLNGEDCLLLVSQDVTERKRMEREWQKLSSALAQTADAVTITDRRGRIEYVNCAFEATTGYSREEVMGRTPGFLKSERQGPEFYRHLWQTVLSGEVFSEVFVNRKKNGSLYYEEKTITPLKDPAGAITHFIATGRDITERMATQDRLQHMAHHDSLTGLPNRALFLDRLKQTLARARWHNRIAAVLFLDLDRFKTINDTLGHEAGDQLLQELAKRLVQCVREGDTVARFGGDEFVLLLIDLASIGDVRQVARKILEAMVPPVIADGHTLHITTSIGVSLFPGDGEDSATLLRNADTAMYRAKDAGRNNVQFYSSEMSARAFERLTLENSLRRALERSEFTLYYQPQVHSASRRIVGVEALVRWRHPEFGLVSPADFVPLLEETGLIVPVGRWVLGEACALLARWSAAGYQELRMAVNLSGRQLTDPGLPGLVSQLLAEHDLAPARLELEITESIAMGLGGAMFDTLETLHALGVRLALDDFGTGYSSLSHLQRLPIDTLKVDRSFVLDIPADPDDVAITRAIVGLGHSLRLELVAEGIETETQREFLHELGCDFMQGYLFSRPLPPEGVEQLLAQQREAGDRPR